MKQKSLNPFLAVLVGFGSLIASLVAEEERGKQKVEDEGPDSKGDWPELQDSPPVRFIRLEHGGTGWDDGMNKFSADANFLSAYSKATGLKAAPKGESHSIALLKKYPADGFPPFVYLTGNQRLGRISVADYRTLRQYCLKEGMLIADAGSVAFHKSFVHLMRQVFPDKRLVEISIDDPIYQIPNTFPDGPPALWHHGGSRPLGIKHQGRWVVFYHPGDMNDAWKAAGLEEVRPEMKEASFKLGINLLHYAFSQWNDAISKAGD